MFPSLCGVSDTDTCYETTQYCFKMLVVIVISGMLAVILIPEIFFKMPAVIFISGMLAVIIISGMLAVILISGMLAVTLISGMLAVTLISGMLAVTFISEMLAVIIISGMLVVTLISGMLVVILISDFFLSSIKEMSLLKTSVPPQGTRDWNKSLKCCCHLVHFLNLAWPAAHTDKGWVELSWESTGLKSQVQHWRRFDSPWGYFAQSRLSVQTRLQHLYSPWVQSHASTSVHKLKVPNTGSHTTVWTQENAAHTGRNG